MEIDFSNSMVEAVNKVIKHYLKFMKINSESELNKAISFAVNDYNIDRPHGCLKGNTPNEVLYEIQINQEFLKKNSKSAMPKRIEINKRNICTKCF